MFSRSVGQTGAGILALCSIGVRGGAAVSRSSLCYFVWQAWFFECIKVSLNWFPQCKCDIAGSTVSLCGRLGTLSA